MNVKTAHPVPPLSIDHIQPNGRLRGRVALVTGGTSGIGRAIAVALAREGARVCIIGRSDIRLADASAEINRFAECKVFQVDLTGPDSHKRIIEHFRQDGSQLDILVHSAGVVRIDVGADGQMADFDFQYAINVRAPYVLTKQLQPMLAAGRGQVVFINSSAGLTAKQPELTQYAATKHSLRAIADSLREELNPKGIRVLTFYLGRTATRLQEALYRQHGVTYRPELLLQPSDVASLLIDVLLLPATAEVTDISMRPMFKSY